MTDAVPEEDLAVLASVSGVLIEILESRNAELEERNAELEERNAELEERNTRLQSKVDGLEERLAKVERGAVAQLGELRDAAVGR